MYCYFYVKLTIRSHSRPFENIDNLYCNLKKMRKGFHIRTINCIVHVFVGIYLVYTVCSALCSNICLSTFHIFREFHSYEHHTHHTNSQRVIAQSNCFGYCAIVRFFCHSDNICWRLLCGTSRQKTFETATFHRIFHSQKFIWNV